MVSPSGVKYGKGWFQWAGHDGDRTIEQQMTGLKKLVSEVPDKSVLDVGCAEGLIGIELAKAGAEMCFGIDAVPGLLQTARELAGTLPCTFAVVDLNHFDRRQLPHVDIVLMLGILHKLKEPAKVCAALAAVARELCVIRLPPAGPPIVDKRSQNVPQDITGTMTAAGFALDAVEHGPFDEWTAYFRRTSTEKVAAKPATKPVLSATIAPVHATMTPTAETQPAKPESVEQAKPEVEPVSTTTADPLVHVQGGQTLFPTEQGAGTPHGDSKVQEDPVTPTV